MQGTYEDPEPECDPEEDSECAEALMRTTPYAPREAYKSCHECAQSDTNYMCTNKYDTEHYQTVICCDAHNTDYYCNPEPGDGTTCTQVYRDLQQRWWLECPYVNTTKCSDEAN